MSESKLNRRAVIKGAVLTFGNVALQSSAQETSKNDLIRKKNVKPGTRDWMLTKTHTTPGKINKILFNGRSPKMDLFRDGKVVRGRQDRHWISRAGLTYLHGNPESTWFSREIRQNRG